MGRFDRNSNRRSGGGGFDRKQTTMYPAVCDQCGKDCKVPFKPSGDKPIYCSNCFEQQGGGNSQRSDRRDHNNRRSFSDSRDRDDRGNREMFSAICDDCGKECKVPFNPSSDKPIYCSECFEKRGNSHDTESKGGCNYDKQSEQLNSIIEKLDQIITALECKCEPEIEKVVKKEAVKKEVKKKTKTVKKAKKE